MKFILLAIGCLPFLSSAQINIVNYSVTVLDQKKYSNAVYKPTIQTVMLYNRNKQNSMPVITLNSVDQLLLCFDDLEGGIKNYFISVELCDAAWNPTNLPALTYLADFTQSRISNYRFSFNTKQKYTYYEAVFPNSEIRPTKSGNYLLKVYENGDESKLILTRRFYVLDNLTNIEYLPLPSTFNDFQSKQQIGLKVNINALSVTDPFSQVKAVVMQNARTDNMMQMQASPFVGNNNLKYNNPDDGIFWGGNEFRYFDISSLRLKGWNVSNLYTRDSINKVVLLNDIPLANQPYIRRIDHYGHFYINNEDGTDSRTDADYATVILSLQQPQLPGNQNLYVVGQFNDWQLHDNHKLVYNTTSKLYQVTLYLKQGQYDYQYIIADKNKKLISTSQIDGSFQETENNYQVLIYYRNFGDWYDQLVGFYKFNWLNKF